MYTSVYVVFSCRLPTSVWNMDWVNSLFAPVHDSDSPVQCANSAKVSEKAAEMCFNSLVSDHQLLCSSIVDLSPENPCAADLFVY